MSAKTARQQQDGQHNFDLSGGERLLLSWRTLPLTVWSVFHRDVFSVLYLSESFHRQRRDG